MPSSRFKPSSLWFLAITLLSFLAASTAPTPLVSPVSGAAALFGGDADPDFRRVRPQPAGGAADRRFAVGLPGAQTGDFHRGVLNMLAMLLFIYADSVAWLISARVLQGFATGMATAVLSATLARHRSPARAVDQQRRAVARHGPGRHGLRSAGRVCAGAVAVDLLVAARPVCVAGRCMSGGCRKASRRQPGAWASLRPTLHVPRAGARDAVAGAAAQYRRPGRSVVFTHRWRRRWCARPPVRPRT